MKETIPQASEEVTAATFDAWLRHAAPGDRLEYYRGDLAFDRVQVRNIPAIGGFAHVYVEPTHSLAEAAWGAYERGKALLTQQKLGYAEYRYLATKRQPPRQRDYQPPKMEQVQ